MVFFTCNACGQSVKKNRVEKHWQNECPNCEVLSCMDCGRDFVGDDYATHTSCVTEAEKYQGDLFKGEKGGVSKGEKKQQEWLECVSASLQAGTYSSRISSLIKRILQYTNIPRKKTKFENFVKNSVNVHDRPTLDSLWEIFNQSAKSTVTMAAQETKPQEVKEEIGNGSSVSQADKELLLVDDDSQSKKKGKKRKKCMDGNGEDEEDGKSETEQVEGKPAKKQKKHKTSSKDGEHVRKKHKKTQHKD